MKKNFMEATEEEKTKTFANTTVFYKNVDKEMTELTTENQNLLE